jgi:hypothetical protein
MTGPDSQGRSFLVFSHYEERIMALTVEELKKAIIEKASKSPKPQLYIKDFYACDPDTKPRDLKKVANALVTEGELMFWSSGSTTMYARPDRIQNEEG